MFSVNAAPNMLWTLLPMCYHMRIHTWVYICFQYFFTSLMHYGSKDDK